MRASFQKDLISQDNYLLKGDTAHHLINVVRVELNEEILLLNGKGLKIKTQVSSLSKRELILTRIHEEQVTTSLKLDLAIGIPKKEALELSLKQAVELGFRRIYLVRSEYSQNKIPESERLESLLISALEQSNAAYLPELIPATWEMIPASEYSEILMMDSQNKTQDVKSNKVLTAKLLIVGPEGGYSPDESQFLHQLAGIRIINLPTPILRTPTAVATGAGILLGSLLD
ncbi:MAG: 16S rRNA (uracil(1498)-N(3))-methyltransferase [Bdellovibrionales bacterium]|nr:16S rRNA (uracil(1498)-N(3))-methyltransferase [Bdellovibrionales bacterium]